MNFRAWIPALLLGLALAAAGCDDSTHYLPPAAPHGVYSVTGDGRADIYWTANTERDLRGYYLYWAPASTGPYKRVGFTTSTHYGDTNVTNGVTYYYGVTAVNDGGFESDLSHENVHDTPRPEGYHVRMYNSYYDSTRLGLYLTQNGIRFADPAPLLQSWTNTRTDIFFNGEPGSPYLWTEDNQTLIRDMGPSSSLEDVDFAPASGWPTDYRVPALLGHTYCVWTRDDHYAKIYITGLNDDWVVFDWAYQIAPSNRELKPVPPAGAASRPRLAQLRRVS
jgi:hypothetical protein